MPGCGKKHPETGKDNISFIGGDSSAYLAKQQPAWSRVISEKGTLETWACTVLLSSSLGLKIHHHNLGGDPSHVGISWPIVMDAQVLVAGFLCAALGSHLYCSYLWQWRCPLLSQNAQQVCLDGCYLTVICSKRSLQLWHGFTEASDGDEKSYMVKWVSFLLLPLVPDP